MNQFILFLVIAISTHAPDTPQTPRSSRAQQEPTTPNSKQSSPLSLIVAAQSSPTISYACGPSAAENSQPSGPSAAEPTTPPRAPQLKKQASPSVPSPLDLGSFAAYSPPTCLVQPSTPPGAPRRVRSQFPDIPPFPQFWIQPPPLPNIEGIHSIEFNPGAAYQPALLSPYLQLQVNTLSTASTTYEGSHTDEDFSSESADNEETNQ